MDFPGRFPCVFHFHQFSSPSLLHPMRFWKRQRGHAPPCHILSEDLKSKGPWWSMRDGTLHGDLPWSFISMITSRDFLQSPCLCLTCAFLTPGTRTPVIIHSLPNSELLVAPTGFLTKYKHPILYLSPFLLCFVLFYISITKWYTTDLVTQIMSKTHWYFIP